MTEEQWLDCTDAKQMLDFLSNHDRASNRKVRLFACGCARLEEDAGSTRAIEAAEAFADGLIDESELTETWEAAFLASEAAKLVAREAWSQARGKFRKHVKAAIATAAARHYAALACTPPATEEVQSGPTWRHDTRLVALLIESEHRFPLGDPNRHLHPSLLRDLFGPLLFRDLPLDPVWFSPTVLSIVQRIYEERDFAAMSILGDALADAGCDNDEILRHCREDEDHVRGCWLLDLLTGRQ
jgi:hypothetical protein